ncbi:mCG144568, partial [Mus musculus]
IRTSHPCWQLSPVGNTKYDSAAADQASRQADSRREPAAAVLSFQQGDTRQLWSILKKPPGSPAGLRRGHRSGKLPREPHEQFVGEFLSTSKLSPVELNNAM